MKILVFIDQYERGGAARVTSTMINGLCRHNHIIYLATNNITRNIGYHIDSRINVISFYGGETHNIIESLIRHLRLIISAIRCVKFVKPDVIIAVTHNPYFYVRVATAFSKIPLIAVDHTSFSRKISVFEDWIRHHFYKYATVLSILTKKDERLLGDKFPNKIVIYNPLSFPPINHATERKKNILVAGRLSSWKIKGFDRIIDIWGKLSTKYPDWILEIAGDGNKESMKYLTQLVEDRGIEKQTIFLGQIGDMQAKLSHTSIFALPSRVEGFPMVLMEAMSQGCACVAFSLDGACNEMMTADSGFMVNDNDVQSFSLSLEKLINNENLRIEFGANAIEASKRFSDIVFINKWEQIIKNSQYEYI